MKTLLFGTTNQSRLDHVRIALRSVPVQIIGPRELNLNVDVDESGETPQENALQKALAFYKAAQQPTFALDAGLYIDKFPQVKQPGVHVRRIKGSHKRPSDEEVLRYYIEELEKVGGESSGEWQVGIALVINPNKVYAVTYHSQTYLKAVPSPVSLSGAPLSSIQYEHKIGKFRSEFTDKEREQMEANRYETLKELITKHLGQLG